MSSDRGGTLVTANVITPVVIITLRRLVLVMLSLTDTAVSLPAPGLATLGRWRHSASRESSRSVTPDYILYAGM